MTEMSADTTSESESLENSRDEFAARYFSGLLADFKSSSDIHEGAFANFLHCSNKCNNSNIFFEKFWPMDGAPDKSCLAVEHMGKIFPEEITGEFNEYIESKLAEWVRIPFFGFRGYETDCLDQFEFFNSLFPFFQKDIQSRFDFMGEFSTESLAFPPCNGREMHYPYVRYSVAMDYVCWAAGKKRLIKWNKMDGKIPVRYNFVYVADPL